MTKKTKKTLQPKILGFLEKQPGRKFKSKTISCFLEIPQTEYTEFRNLLRSLAQKSVIAKVGRNVYQYKKKPTLAIGALKVKTQGYGFVKLTESDQELFISQRNMATALDGDLVAVQVFAQPGKGLLAEGKIDHVIERKRKFIVGTYKRGKYFNFVAPDDLKIPWDIIIHDDFSKRAEPGQKVAVTIDYWEETGLNPTGQIVEILGFPKDTGVDISSVAYAFNLPLSFPEKVDREAAQITGKLRKRDLENRIDLRQLNCFTIDPEDAKDFDDAVSLEKIANGKFRLGVHIADVSHFVEEGSETDKEALKRATSVYLVDRVIPMLPEKLSNQICSLQADQDRLTFSVLMTMDRAGSVLNYEIKPSVIRSKRRFSYEEVVEILKSGKGDFVQDLTEMRDLSQRLFRARLQAGSLDFETTEVKIELDESGRPVAIHRKKSLESHRLIEEFMLLANRVVAEHIALRLPEKYQLNRKWPFVYRIHEKPTKEKISDFANLVKSLGFEFKGKKRIHAKHLSDVLAQAKGLPEEDIINQVMLRSLMKAKYDTKNVGHFGLAFHHYTHFTSPIRRYPDLIVHRLLKEYAGQPAEERLAQLRLELPEICRIATDQEINAMEAERRSIKMKKVEFMTDKLGEEYNGIISGIVPFGIFVEIVDYLIDGLVHVKDLTSDYYIYDEANFRLVGKTSGVVYRLGDRVKIKVIRVVPEERLVDFHLIEDAGKAKVVPPGREAGKKKPS
ncbi:MAG TPA: ribonuclease R [Bacteroidetes bacterium]|nr:ribonuclease R [Bacteroidota bacterium]